MVWFWWWLRELALRNGPVLDRSGFHGENIFVYKKKEKKKKRKDTNTRMN
jgi:hypothetical protein